MEIKKLTSLPFFILKSTERDGSDSFEASCTMFSGGDVHPLINIGRGRTMEAAVQECLVRLGITGRPSKYDLGGNLYEVTLP